MDIKPGDRVIHRDWPADYAGIVENTGRWRDHDVVTVKFPRHKVISAFAELFLPAPPARVDPQTTGKSPVSGSAANDGKAPDRQHQTVATA